ncbi:site-2 protease family protein [Streptomyces cocklensis]|uniref:Membrane-associated zinc metalloprotease n=1 Tax=Actinacidiphila cocklensis TaxID=887465 RepID=A0A9W4DKA3_9ACTN|nr:site-2 protease family protein [Actinacidiphila cocklensis]MDD1060037.1 site-2 protease family protein [Actinacidiphila cocklensis]WSX76488.1 site-2 protease family protein [Streptomyces sp. NBC_00899]CAG6391609.1 Membrane-associated zinc metalloprotease [Actinacidiphila cocklensis]
MTALMTVLGIVVFAVGLMVSIAWHELGHLSTAKLFKIRVPQYMVGFGPTVWSRKKGETEYGFKAIPLGGYIRMIGMFPPGEDGRITARSTSPWRSMIEDARSAAYEELQPGDETRLFYTRKPWKRVIVMFAGPFMNLILAFALALSVFMGIGIAEQTTVVSSVSDCVISQADTAKRSPDNPCLPSDPVAPAKTAGFQPGDKFVSFNGRPVDGWADLSKDIRTGVGPATIVVERAGKQVTLHPVITKNVVAKTDSDGNVQDGTVTAGFLGFSPASHIQPQGFTSSVSHMGDMAKQGMDSLLRLPQRIPDLWRATFDGAPRKADSPMGVVGAARVGGEVFSLKEPAIDRIATMVMLVAGFNLSLFLFNMLPLLPLDGGHVAGALWESLRRHTARVFRRPDPGPFDVAKLMPVAYIVAGIFVSFTLLVLIADVVNPVKLSS